MIVANKNVILKNITKVYKHNNIHISVYISIYKDLATCTDFYFGLCILPYLSSVLFDIFTYKLIFIFELLFVNALPM